MLNRRRQESTESTNNIPSNRHHGGQELPDDVQDRPEQNAGYDAAVRGDGEPMSRPFTGLDTEDLDLTDLDQDLDQQDETGDLDLPD